MYISIKTKASLLIMMILSAEAARIKLNITSENVQLRSSAGAHAGGSTLPTGIQAVSVYAAGNCQFMPLFDVAHFMAETAPVAARAGMMAKPVVTGAGVAAQGAVHMGSKAGLLSRLAGGMFGISNPAGLALNIGLTAYQLWQLQKMLKNPTELCKFASMIPPFSTTVCAGLGNVTGGQIALPPKPPPGITDQMLRPEIVLAATAVLLVSVGGFAIWHQRVRKVAYDKAFCPASKWTQDPKLPFQIGESGMSRCNGLHRVNLPVHCGTNMECRQASCQQACCDEEGCSMYQFDASEPSNQPLSCWLGNAEKSFTAKKCSKWSGLVKSSEVDGETGTTIFHSDARLFDQVHGLSGKKVRLDRKLPDPDAGKMKKCKKLCDEDDSCTFFQVTPVDELCWIGYEALDTYTTSEWYGGILAEPASSPRGCEKTEKACPSLARCVQSCAECEGFSLDGNDGECKRSADEAVCDPDSWSHVYNDRSLDSVQCVGLEPLDVVLDEDTPLNGHGICREACCGDSDCVLYQVRQKDVKVDSLTKGTKVHCWLGKVDSSFNPLFTCEREVKEGFGIRQWAGAYLEKRGCGIDQFSCILTNECVADCASQCPGASLQDDQSRQCTQNDIESVGVGQIQEHGIPAISSHPLSDLEDEAIVQSTGGAYWLHDDEAEDAVQLAAADSILMIAQNKRRLITSGQTSQTICDNLAIGAYECSAKGAGCSCDYMKPQTCSNWFFAEGNLRPIVLAKGLVLLSYDTCHCSPEKTNDRYACQFDFMDAIPKIKLARSDEAVVSI
jgi:hypothetical protein